MAKIRQTFSAEYLYKIVYKKFQFVKGLDRINARAVMSVLFQRHNNPRFIKPPLSSRTVGFPESGWRLWHFLKQPFLGIEGLSSC